MGVHKKFSQKLFDQNDELARATITKFLESRNLEVRPNPNKFGVDLYVYHPAPSNSPDGANVESVGQKADPFYAVECEIKRVWHGSVLPWSTVQLPWRKKKYSDDEAVPVEYWILNNELTHAIVIYEAELTDKRLTEVRNKYVDRGEYFYQIPLDVCSIVELK